MHIFNEKKQVLKNFHPSPTTPKNPPPHRGYRPPPLGTFVHFIGNSNLGKIRVDTDIFAGVMKSSKKKSAVAEPPINLITSEIC